MKTIKEFQMIVIREQKKCEERKMLARAKALELYNHVLAETGDMALANSLRKGEQQWPIECAEYEKKRNLDEAWLKLHQ